MGDAILISYYDARRLLLGVIQRALFDLDSADPLIRKEAHDWLLKYGAPLAAEVEANIPIHKFKELINQFDVTTGAFIGEMQFRIHGLTGRKITDTNKIDEGLACEGELADFVFSGGGLAAAVDL